MEIGPNFSNVSLKPGQKASHLFGDAPEIARAFAKALRYSEGFQRELLEESSRGKNTADSMASNFQNVTVGPIEEGLSPGSFVADITVKEFVTMPSEAEPFLNWFPPS